MDDELKKAVAFLKEKCNVSPIGWTRYQKSFFFLAFPDNMSDADKSRCMTPYYLVDLSNKKAGPFSRMFDPDGYDRCTQNLHKIE